MQESPDLPPLELTAKNPIALRKGEVSAKDGSLLQGIDLSAADPSAVPGLVREIMGSKLLRVIDVFRQLDDDDSGFIDGPEFAKGLKEMGCAAPPAAVGALFASLDPDGSGLIEYDELHEVLVRSVQESPELPPLELEAKNPIALRTAPLAKKDANLFQGAVDLANAAPEALPGLIRDALNAKLTRVIDLFRQLDDDASGTIDAREFAKGLREMGLNAPKEAIGAIFDSFNEDGGAFIECVGHAPARTSFAISRNLSLLHPSACCLLTHDLPRTHTQVRRAARDDHPLGAELSGAATLTARGEEPNRAAEEED